MRKIKGLDANMTEESLIMEASDMFAGQEMDGAHAHNHGDTHMFAHTTVNCRLRARYDDFSTGLQLNAIISSC